MTRPAYRIRYRITSVNSGQYLAVVSLLPPDSDEEGSESHSESRLFSSMEIARAECERMIEAMKDRLALQGLSVSSVSAI